jgi:diketogulonate reductase-like aldo/keto reductase
VNYENEAEVGEAVRRSGIRDELIVTTKVPGPRARLRGDDPQRPRLLERLGLERIDLYLIHWPNPSVTATSRRSAP